jgi:hypothetical protein
LRRLVSSLGGTWGLAEEVMPVIEFWAELYPSSERAKVLLAQGHLDVGDYPAAIEAYSLLLERYPGNSFVTSQLEWLRRQ